MNRRKKSLTYLLLLPLLLVVLLQGIVPFSILLASGTRETMERNTVDIDSNLVENQSVVLQNAMVDQWSGIRNESNFLTNMLVIPCGAGYLHRDLSGRFGASTRLCGAGIPGASGLSAAGQLLRRVPDSRQQRRPDASGKLRGLFPAGFRPRHQNRDKLRPSD